MRNQKHQEAKWKALLWSKGPQERRSRGDQGTEQRAGSSRERPGDLGHPRRPGRVTRRRQTSLCNPLLTKELVQRRRELQQTDKVLNLQSKWSNRGGKSKVSRSHWQLTCSDHADLPAQPWPSLGQSSGSSGEGGGWEGAPESTSSICPPVPVLLGSWMSARVYQDPVLLFFWSYTITASSSAPTV